MTDGPTPPPPPPPPPGPGQLEDGRAWTGTRWVAVADDGHGTPPTPAAPPRRRRTDGELRLLPGDVVAQQILCTDGLWHSITEADPVEGDWPVGARVRRGRDEDWTWTGAGWEVRRVSVLHRDLPPWLDRIMRFLSDPE